MVQLQGRVRSDADADGSWGDVDELLERDRLIDQILACHNSKRQKSLVCSVTLVVPIKLVGAFLYRLHCSVTQGQPVSETCLSNSDNCKFRQHTCYTCHSDLLKVIQLNCVPSQTCIFCSGREGQNTDNLFVVQTAYNICFLIKVFINLTQKENWSYALFF